MSSDIPCDLDNFGATLEQMLGSSLRGVEKESNEAVEKATRRGARLLRGKYTDNIGKTEWSERYRKGFTSHIEKGKLTTGEIGNKAVPGLVHLLEKGHATLTGRRTKAYPHMGPAFEDIEEDYVKRMEKAVTTGLEQ